MVKRISARATTAIAIKFVFPIFGIPATDEVVQHVEDLMYEAYAKGVSNIGGGNKTAGGGGTAQAVVDSIFSGGGVAIAQAEVGHDVLKHGISHAVSCF